MNEYRPERDASRETIERGAIDMETDQERAERHERERREAGERHERERKEAHERHERERKEEQERRERE